MNIIRRIQILLVSRYGWLLVQPLCQDRAVDLTSLGPILQPAFKLPRTKDSSVSSVEIVDFFLGEGSGGTFFYQLFAKVGHTHNWRNSRVSAQGIR
jgi:hypothetical protein